MILVVFKIMNYLWNSILDFYSKDPTRKAIWPQSNHHFALREIPGALLYMIHKVYLQLSSVWQPTLANNSLIPGTLLYMIHKVYLQISDVWQPTLANNSFRHVMKLVAVKMT